MPIPVIVILVVVVAGAIGAWVYMRGQKPSEKHFYHFRCAGCRRRLRYRAEQVGHKGGCSHCGREVIFPPVSDSVE